MYRPQFDNSATAVILTKQEKVKKYEQLVSGTEVLESWSVDSCIIKGLKSNSLEAYI